MPSFTSYPHIERLGNDEVEDITIGRCYIFPKIDGTQASVWLDDNGARSAASRTRMLSEDADNAGFYAHVTSAPGDALANVLLAHPAWVLYGEWLVPHSLKTYRDDAWRHLYVFDVFDTAVAEFLPYDTYAPVLEAAEVAYIPVLEITTNPSDEHLLGLLNRNLYLLKDGCGVGEGIVIKRYDYRNRYGRTVWAKLVRNEFKEQNARAFGPADVTMSPFEEGLAREFVTIGRVSKLKERLRETGPLSSKRIPELLGRVWHDIITEEMWNLLTKHKRAVIDFGKFQQFVILQVKALSPELFGAPTPPVDTAAPPVIK